MKYTYTTVGCHAKEISFDINGNVITNVKFVEGCPGNTLAVAALANGRTVEEIEKLCKGINCPRIPEDTSCPDQFAIAVRKAYEETK